MRRVLLTLVGVVAAASSVMGTAAPANAGTTCTNNAYSDGMGWYRFCKINTSITGANINGVVSWDYNSPKSKNPNAQTGQASLEVTDTRKDGSCAWIKARYFKSSTSPNTTNYFDACGKGTSERVSLEMNKQTAGKYSDGYFSFAVCSPKITCTRVWKQAVAAKGPS